MTQWGLDVLFNPAKRHMDEEKRRLQSTREEIGDSSGGKRIDFESGKVVIERPADAEDGADPAGGPDAATGEDTAAPAVEKNAQDAPDSAAPVTTTAKDKGRTTRKNGTGATSAARTAAAERGAERHRRARAKGRAQDTHR